MKQNFRLINPDVVGSVYNFHPLPHRRRPGAIDYSQPIRGFCEEHSIEAPELAADVGEAMPYIAPALGAEEAGKRILHASLYQRKIILLKYHLVSPGHGRMQNVADMAETTFAELGLRAGPATGYVYIHQVLCSIYIICKISTAAVKLG